ncbi:MAG: hypothetical protein ABJJ53_13150 [Sulfitobacter sp.]
MSGLHAQICQAHAASDLGQLVTLYAQAANEAPDLDASCFFLTHAFVFALESGDARSTDLRQQLVAQGREAPD